MIGTDIIDKRRIATLYQKHGQRLAEKILHPDELAQLPAQKDPARYLALRWAAKEALGKAFGTGLRAPLVMPAICLSKSALGAPAFAPTVVVQTMQTASPLSGAKPSDSERKKSPITAKAKKILTTSHG